MIQLLSRPLALTVVTLLAACGGAATPGPAATATAVTATPTAAATTTPGSAAGAGLRWEVTSGSKATVRVNEQLANVSSPSDAVLTTSAVTGGFELRPDGTFTPASKITVDLTTLTSDRSQRDQFIKSNTLETARFREAEFTPTRTSGLTVPLPAGADMAFTITGTMRIHGTEKELTFDVTARRTGDTLTAAAKAAPFTFGDFGMQQPRVAVVLSVKDEIRLEIELTAKERAGG